MSFIKIIEKMITVASNMAIPLLWVSAIALLTWIFKDEGLAGIWTTIKVDVVKVTLRFIPVIVVFFLITGSINHLAKSHQKEFGDTLAGKNGTVKMVVLATLMPGPAGGQQMQEAWKNPDTNKAKFLVCFVAMMALGVNIFIFRARVLGGSLTLLWFGMALIFLAQVWFVGKAWTKFFA